eukprot:2678301-Rhodomonas_salina.1
MAVQPLFPLAMSKQGYTTSVPSSAQTRVHHPRSSGERVPHVTIVSDGSSVPPRDARAAGRSASANAIAHLVCECRRRLRMPSHTSAILPPQPHATPLFPTSPYSTPILLASYSSCSLARTLRRSVPDTPSSSFELPP